MTRTPGSLAAYLLADVGGESEGPSFECPTCPGSVVLRLFGTTRGTYLVGMGTSLTPAAPQPCGPMAYPLDRLEQGQVWTTCGGCGRTVWAWTTPDHQIGVTSSKATGLDGRLEVPKVMAFEDGGFTFTMAARPETVASLLVVCPNHPEEHLAMWERDAEGGTSWTHADGVRVENIAPPVEGQASDLFTPPDAAPAAGDPAHTRYVFRCNKPSCNYNGQVVSGNLAPKVEAALDGMVAAGLPLLRVTSPEAPGTLKPAR